MGGRVHTRHFQRRCTRGRARTTAAPALHTDEHHQSQGKGEVPGVTLPRTNKTHETHTRRWQGLSTSTRSIAAQMPPAGTGTPSNVQVALSGLHRPKQSTICLLQSCQGPWLVPQQRSCAWQHWSAQLGPLRVHVSGAILSSQFSSWSHWPLHQPGPQ
jgi:hypothetical protein